MVIFNEKPPDLKDFVARCQSFSLRPALISDGKTYTYESLLRDSAALAQFLLGDRPDIQEARIAFFIPSSYAYVLTQWGIFARVCAAGYGYPLADYYPRASGVFGSTGGLRKGGYCLSGGYSAAGCS